VENGDWLRAANSLKIAEKRCRAKLRFAVLGKYGFLFSVHDARRGRIREEEPVLLHTVDFDGPEMGPRRPLKNPQKRELLS